jgi:hypothetical protein
MARENRLLMLRNQELVEEVSLLTGTLQARALLWRIEQKENAR